MPRIIIDVNLDDIKLPDYVYTIQELMDESEGTFEECCEAAGIKEEDAEDYRKTEPVSKRDTNKFKKKLFEFIKDDIEILIEDYISYEMDEPSLMESVNRAGDEVYSCMEDLSDEVDYQIKIKVI